MTFARSSALYASLMLAAGTAASAEEYTPDVAVFDGSSTLMYAAEPEFSMADGGTIEFWLAPGWTSDPGYDPVVLSNAGAGGVAYVIAVLRDRDGLGMRFGDNETYVSFDFTDGRFHHVGLVYDSDTLLTLIDGQVRGRADIRLRDTATDNLWIGTADGQTAPFVGAMAALRFWDVALEREELVNFSSDYVMRDDYRHPALEHLRAVSDFEIDELYVVDPATSPDGENGYER